LLHSHCIMRNMRAFLIIVLLASLSMAQSPKPKALPINRPSFDSLINRIDSYWKLLQLRKKLQATQYIAPSDRDYFINSETPSFSDPRLKSLEFSPDRTEATATVVVKRILFPITQAMDWQVVEKWHFEKGNWYRCFNKTALPLQSKSGASGQKLDAQEIENVRREIREIMKIETPVLDFGTVRENAPVQLNLKYTLKGEEPLVVEYKPTGSGFVVQGLEGRQLFPGQNKELHIGVSTWYFEGEVDERLVLIAQRKGIEVPFEIKIIGKVYLPISVTPKVLIFDKSENEKEILISNNSKTNVDLLQVSSETGLVVIEPIPTSIPPGQKLSLKASLAKKSWEIQPNTRDSIAIILAKSVDDVAAVSISVVMNSTKPKPNSITTPVISDEIQQLIRKYQVNLPDRSK
jgi:hypothetical protein